MPTASDVTLETVLSLQATDADSGAAVANVQQKLNATATAVAGKENTIAAGTTSQYWRGDKSWQTLDKAAVSLANVDNTSDATKNSSVATLTNKTISGASNTLSNIPANTALTSQVAIANGGTGQSTKTAAFDGLSPMTTSGDLIYGATAGSGTRLAAGSNGHLLTMVAGVPAWSAAGASGAMVLIGTASASASSAIDFTSISNASYEGYLLLISDLLPTTTNVNLNIRMSIAGVFQTTNYRWQNFRYTSAASGLAGNGPTEPAISLTAAGADAHGNNSPAGSHWVVHFSCPNTSTQYKRITYSGSYFGNSGAHISIHGMGHQTATNAYDGIRIIMDVGTIATGRFALYGIKNT